MTTLAAPRRKKPVSVPYQEPDWYTKPAVKATDWMAFKEDYRFLLFWEGTVLSAGRDTPEMIIGQPKSVYNCGPGDILYVETTDTSMVAVMAKAGAIVVTRGGILSHAAIVGRELGVPVIRVPVATDSPYSPEYGTFMGNLPQFAHPDYPPTSLFQIEMSEKTVGVFTHKKFHLE